MHSGRMIALVSLCALLMLSAFAITLIEDSDADVSPSSGSGTESDPYVYNLTKGTAATVKIDSLGPFTKFYAVGSDITIPGMTFTYGSWSGSTLSTSGQQYQLSSLNIGGTPTSAGSWTIYGYYGGGGVSGYYKIVVSAPVSENKTWTFYDTDGTVILKRITVAGGTTSVTMPSAKSTNTNTAVERWAGMDWWLPGKYDVGTSVTITSSNFKDTSFYAYKTAYAKVTGITITGSEDCIKVGGTISLTATVSPSTANPNVTWSSSNKSVATVSSSGVVTGLSGGYTLITATSKDGSVTSDTYLVNVIAVSIVCPTYCVVGETLNATATASAGTVT